MRNRSAWIVAAGLISLPVWAQPDTAPPSPAAAPPAEASPAPEVQQPSAPTQAPAEPANPAPTPVAPAPPADEPKPAPPELPPEPPPALGPPAVLPPTVGSPPKDEVPSEPAPLGEPHDLGLELGLGLNARMSSATNYADDRGSGVGYALGFWVHVASRAALGLELSYADLGRASAASGQNLIETEFASTGLWLGARLFPWQSPSVRLFLAPKVGLSVQHVAASGVRQTGSALEPATAFDCSGSSGPEFGLGAVFGAAFRLNPRLDLVPQVGVRDERMTSEDIDGCATGLGSTASFSAGVSVAYGFDGPKSGGGN